MAVGIIIIGVAFGKIVSSFVADVVMPPLGSLSAAWISRISRSRSAARLARPVHPPAGCLAPGKLAPACSQSV
jgi:large-conductance mechanosensitive channel